MPMPGRFVAEILKDLIPLQEVDPLLQKIAEAACRVSGGGRCLIVRWDNARNGWQNMAAFPPDTHAGVPFTAALSREIMEKRAPVLADGGSPHFQRITGNLHPITAFMSVPLIFPSSSESCGLLYVDTGREPHAFVRESLDGLATFANLASLCLENSLLFEKATYDELTRALTKSFFLARLEEEYQRALRSRTCFALFMCDVDDFKRINDTYGHLAGDRILRLFTETLKRNIRVYDLVGRYGGDEFMILQPGLDLAHIYPVAQKIVHALERVDFGLPEAVTFSLGAAIYPVHGGSGSLDLLMQADLALYQAKGAGKGRIIILGRETPILSSRSTSFPKPTAQNVSTQDLVFLQDLAAELRKVLKDKSSAAGIEKAAELAASLQENLKRIISE